MTTILLKDLTDEEILELIDENAKHILIPNFRPNDARLWWTTDLKLTNGNHLRNLSVRDLTVDLVITKQTLNQIFKEVKFGQLAIYIFNKVPPDTLKIDDLPKEQVDKILIQNGLKLHIWINFEFVELSSPEEEYLISITNKHHLKRVS